MNDEISKLAWEISNCGEVSDASVDGAHPCHQVVGWQVKKFSDDKPSISSDEILARRLQRPEAWTGDLRNAKILFLASNPSLDANELFPTWDTSKGAWPKEAVIDFATRRFVESQSRGFGATDGPTLDDADRVILTTGMTSKRVNHWRWVRNLSAFMLGLDPAEVSAHSDYVMTEIVHCKSTYEAGVPSAIPRCTELWLDRLWRNSGAEIVVIAGAKAGVEFARLYGDQLPDSWGVWTKKAECPTKGKGIWPKSLKQLKEWTATGFWGDEAQRSHTAEVVLGGKPRLVVFFARPGHSRPSAPWNHPNLVSDAIRKMWQDRLNG